MPNQDIITSLNNAVSGGESLQMAMQIMVNSGYNLQEVQEASKFVAGGVIPQMQARPSEEMVVPEEKSFFKKMNPFKGQSQVPGVVLSQAVPQQIPQPAVSTQKPVQALPGQRMPVIPGTQTPQQSQISPEGLPIRQPQKTNSIKKSYFKEIVLLIILLFFMGILISTIIFRDDILRFFSG